MLSQVLLPSAPLLALPAPLALPLLPMAQPQPPAAHSAPAYSPPLHVLLDPVPRAGLRDHIPSTSPQHRPVPVSIPSHHPPNVPPSRPRPPSSGSSSRPSTDTDTDPRTDPSPSPPQTSFLHPSFGAPPHNPNHQLPSSAISYSPNMDRYSITNLADRYLRATDKYSHNQHPLQDQRRMSEPAMRGGAPSGYPTTATDLSSPRYHQLHHPYSYDPPRSYAALSSSPLHRSPDTHPIGGSSWKEDHRLQLHPYDSVQLEEPLSPLNPTFSGGESSPPMGMSTAMFESLREEYGPSPPGTGTSTSSNAPATIQHVHSPAGSSSPSNNKQYSFVSLPGNAVKKRPRRRYDEIERLYQCSWPNCAKAYGTLNHLNAHITMQKHGTKRSPNEFKELRKQWRKAKKEEAEARALDAVRHGSHPHQHSSQHHPSRHSMSDADYQTQHPRPSFDYVHHSERSAQPIGALDDFHDPLVPQQDVYPRRSQRYTSFVPPHAQHGGMHYPDPHPHGVHTSTVPVDRLPANSTLLTPLPGYAPSMSGAPSFNAYDSYDPYRNDNRPRAGHGHLGTHTDRGRPRSSHVNPGS